GSPLLCYGFACPCMHRGKGTFLYREEQAHPMTRDVIGFHFCALCTLSFSFPCSSRLHHFLHDNGWAASTHQPGNETRKDMRLTTIWPILAARQDQVVAACPNRRARPSAQQSSHRTDGR